MPDPREGTGGIRFRVLCRTLRIKFADGIYRELKRGDAVYLEDLHPMAAVKAAMIRGPHDGSESLRKLYRYQREHSRDSHGRFKHVEEPERYSSKVIPAIEVMD